LFRIPLVMFVSCLDVTEIDDVDDVLILGDVSFGILRS